MSPANDSAKACRAGLTRGRISRSLSVGFHSLVARDSSRPGTSEPRIRALAPIFAQGSVVEPMFHADTLYWKLELYSASSNFPLSQHLVLAGEERSYFKHAATALVNARTARVMIAADPSPDPISLAWMTRFPNSADYRAPGIARELTTTPWEPVTSAPLAGSDSAFRAAVTRLYNRMRAALTSANLREFGIAYDSLGALIATHPQMTDAKRTAVIAVGGNALSPPGERSTIADQFRHTRESLGPIVDLALDGWSVCVVHGNGPQVGDELVRNEKARSEALRCRSAFSSPARPAGSAT